MTEKVYYQDGYLKKIEAEVRKLDGNRLYLDRTILYPEGGGPPGDKGTFRNLEIIDTLKDGDDVVHILRHPCDLKAGDRGELCLSWDYRYHYMQMHTAQHLVDRCWSDRMVVVISNHLFVVLYIDPIQVEILTLCVLHSH